MAKVLIEISELGDRVTVNGETILEGDLDISVYDYREQEENSIVKLELWFEPKAGPQMRTHFSSEMQFEDVKQKMIALRDKLTEEIEKGKDCCPFSGLDKS